MNTFFQYREKGRQTSLDEVSWVDLVVRKWRGSHLICFSISMKHKWNHQLIDGEIWRAADGLRECCCCCCQVASDVSDSVRPHRRQPSGSAVPGILQARTLQWVAISFSNAWKWKVKVKSLGRVQLLVTPWTAVHQAPPSMGFSRQEHWGGVPLPT